MHLAFYAYKKDAEINQRLCPFPESLASYCLFAPSARFPVYPESRQDTVLTPERFRLNCSFGYLVDISRIHHPSILHCYNYNFLYFILSTLYITKIYSKSVYGIFKNASTTCGSNCDPEHLLISSHASSCVIIF